MNTIIILLSLIALVATTSASKPEIAMLELTNNVEYGTTYGDFRVLYAGVKVSESINENDQATINIYKDGEQKVFHNYKVPANRKSDNSVFYFGFKDVDPGSYEVEVCHGEDCSARSRSFSKLVDYENREKLECSRVRWNATSNEEEFSSSFQLEVIGPYGFMPNVENLPKAKALTLTAAEDQNPIYKDGTFYTAVNYGLSHYRPLFDIARTEIEKTARAGQEYSLEYCSRKYNLIANVHLLNPETKEVVHRFKTSLYLPESLWSTYITGTGADVNPVPVELSHKHEIAPGKYQVWVAFCAVDKDLVDSTIDCSKPLIYEKDFTIAAEGTKK